MNASQSEEKQAAEISAGAEHELAKAPAKPDLVTRLEEQSYALSRAKTQLAKATVRSLKQDIKERKKYAKRIFILISSWVAAMLLILVAQGINQFHYFKFSLSQPVLLAAIGSTTVNVLGLFYIVAHYLFPTPDSQKTDRTLTAMTKLGTSNKTRSKGKKANQEEEVPAE